MLFKLIKPLRLLAIPAVVIAAACDNPVENDDAHLDDVESVEITDLEGNMIAEFHEDHWHIEGGGDALHLHPGDEIEIAIYFVTADGERFQLPPAGAEHTLHVAVANSAIAEYEGHDDHGHLVALAAGETTAAIQVYHGTYPSGHADWQTTPPLDIEVVDHGDH